MRAFFFTSIGLVFSMMTAEFALAQHKFHLLRRIAVFPILVQGLEKSEDAWWQMREQLTKDQRFLVASRRFMINRGVFQARRDLKPADAIILSKILDAQALIISAVEERKLSVKVYEGENGFILWESSVEFHPALSMSDQIVSASQKLVTDFVNDFPYQGFVVVDSLKNVPVFEESGKRYSWIYHGPTKTIDVGDPAEGIEFEGETSKPFFKNGTATVVAQGSVAEVQNDRSLIAWSKLRKLDDLKENALIRFPKEAKRLAEMYSSQGRDTGLSPEYLSSEMRPIQELDKRHDSTATSLAFIFNMAAMILLMF